MLTVDWFHLYTNLSFVCCKLKQILNPLHRVQVVSHIRWDYVKNGTTRNKDRRNERSHQTKQQQSSQSSQQQSRRWGEDGDDETKIKKSSDVENSKRILFKFIKTNCYWHPIKFRAFRVSSSRSPSSYRNQQSNECMWKRQNTLISIST